MGEYQEKLLAVHPRACGEQYECHHLDHWRNGSSPRLRGTDPLDETPHESDRFIPAPAGNRFHPQYSAQSPAVHPRACGEQLRNGFRKRRPSGSSPRLRGTAHDLGPLKVFGRFIPAPAGNSADAAPGTGAEAVHPRACGEQFLLKSRINPGSGSSPRLRGTALGFNHQVLDPRFIPAPAGNSHRQFLEGEGIPVHPRACGEQTPLFFLDPTGLGSSPRLRGTGPGGRGACV